MRSVPRCVSLRPNSILDTHRAIFNDLLNTNTTHGLNCTLRVAGGWVRDIMLDIHSNDIDIAIESPPCSTVSGETFARAVSEYVASSTNTGARTVGVIRTNPEMSKHIETATVVVRGIQVEFCMLRADDYTDGDNRIPQIRRGTPTEDAYRRDFTINTLFYNLHTEQVEDFITVRNEDETITTALDDLWTFKTIRCPLAPRQTFEDDPLRLLRGVRFVGQLGALDYTLHPNIPACVDATLRKLLLHKVSRERIGKEFAKMLSGYRPERCVQLLDEMRLLQEVLLVEVCPLPSAEGASKHHSQQQEMQMLTWDNESLSTEWQLLRFLNASVTPRFATLPDEFQCSSDAKLVACLFELLIPFLRGLPAKDVEARLLAVCMSGLKLPAAVSQATRRMIDCFNELLALGLGTEELLAETITDATKHKLFVALGHLNDKQVLPCTFCVVMCTYTAMEGMCDALNTKPEQVWSRLCAHPEILNAYSTPLPMKGNELRKLIPSMRPADIGASLLYIREQMMLQPWLSRADVEERLVRWYSERQ